MEILNYATYDQAEVLFDIMGFGQSLDEVPLILSPGILTMAWGSVVAPDRRRARRRARRDRRVARAGAGARGVRHRLRAHRGGHHGGDALRGARHGRRPGRSSCSSTSPGCATTSPPTGRSRPGHGGYRVVVTGEPNYTLDLQMLGTDGDHNTAGLKATAMRLVNAVPAVVAAPPGLLTALDLPLVTGRGLVS